MTGYRFPQLVFSILLAVGSFAQGAEPYVDHWDAKKTIK